MKLVVGRRRRRHQRGLARAPHGRRRRDRRSRKRPAHFLWRLRAPVFIEGQVRSLDDLTVYTPEFFEKERNIRVRTWRRSGALHPARREAVLADGERAGLRPPGLGRRRRPRQRFDDPRVFSLHTDTDAIRLKPRFAKATPHGRGRRRRLHWPRDGRRATRARPRGRTLRPRPAPAALERGLAHPKTITERLEAQPRGRPSEQSRG
jgi:hypothetical protein